MKRSHIILIILYLLIILTCGVVILVKLWLDSSVIFKSFNDDVLDMQALKFKKYLEQFGKSYSENEYHRRFQNFKASLVEIARLNTLEGRTVFGLTKFSDMSQQEFAETMLMKRTSKKCSPKKVTECPEEVENVNASTYQYSNTIPDKFDWREVKDVIGPVQDQKMCYGCWAFSLVGVMESMARIQKVGDKMLSVQELLDCSSYNAGCKGGNVATALRFLCRKNVGVVSEDEYPLTLARTENCSLSNLEAQGVKLKGYNHQCYVNEDMILRSIVEHGPVTVIVNASPWFNYLGGIIRRACVRMEHSYDHVVQIVGFDKSGEIPYYIVRNSWGEFFGDHGYVKVAIYGNVCGIAEEVTEIDVK